MDHRTRHEHIPHTALGHEGPYICTDRPQFEKKTPERNAAEKEGASTRQAAGRRRGGHHTLAVRLTHTRNSDSEHLVVSWWCKFEHMFSYSVFAIVNVQDLCSNIERGHNESTFNITFREEFL